MSALAKIDRNTAIQDLADLLEESTRYGKIRIHRMDDGWYCCIAMNTNSTGTTFEVKSQFDHATATEATQCCLQRMHAALRTLGVA